MQEIPKELTYEWSALSFAVDRSIRYHDRRRSFFERAHRITNFLTVLMAGAVVQSMGQSGEPAWWLTFIGFLAALMAASDMVVGYGSCASLHFDLKKRFGDIQIDLENAGDRSEAALAKLKAKRLRIEQLEPPIYRALDLLCHNETLVARGYKKEEDPKHFAELGWWQQMTCQVWPWADVRGCDSAKQASSANG